MHNKYSTNEHPDDFGGDLYEERQIEKESKKMKTSKAVTVKFEGIDSFNRPVFKSIDGCRRYGSTDKLFSKDAKIEDIIKELTHEELVYFGERFDCEPLGSNAYCEIIDKYKSRPCTLVLKLMDEAYGYEEAFKIALIAYPEMCEKQLNKELSRFI